MKIVVTGSLGHIGKPLTEKLVSAGHEVSVISSKANRAAEIEALNAKALIGSVTDAEFLQAAFKQADAVYLMTPPNPAEPQIPYYKTVAASYAKALSDSKVKKLVYLSSFGAEHAEGTGIIKGSYASEQILKALPNIAATFLRPAWFYYNIHNFANTIKNAGAVFANYGSSTKVLMVHPADIAEAAAEELTSDRTGERVRYVASDDLTGAEIAKIYGNAAGLPDLKWHTVTDEQAKQGMLGAGMPAGFVEDLVELGAATESGLLRKDFDATAQQITGKRRFAETVSEFVPNSK